MPAVVPCRAMMREKRSMLAQALGRDGRVLDEGDGLAVALHRHREAERGFAKAPDACLCRGIGDRAGAARGAAGLEVARQRLQPGRQLVGVVAVELDAEQRRAVAFDDAAAHGVEGGVVARVAEDEVVHHLHGGGVVPERDGCGPKSVQQMVELRGQQGLGGRQRDEADGGFHDKAQRALGSNHDAREVHGPGRIHERVEVVTAHPAEHLREAASDLRGMRLRQRGNGAVGA